MTVAAPRSLRARFFELPAHRQGLLAVLGAAVLWSTGGLFIKAVNLDALGVTMWRSLLAAISIALLMRTGVPNPLRATALEWALAVSYALMLVLFVSATKLTTAANAIFLQYTAPLYVLILGRFLLDERPSTVDLACVAVAFAGMALFFVGRLETDDLWGNVSAVASGVSFAFFLTLLRHRNCASETRPRSMVLGNMLLVVAMLAINVGRAEWAAFTPGLLDIIGLVFLGVVQIGLAYVLFGFGIAHVQALEASLIGMLEPVLNPVWVFLFLGETPGWWAVLGGAVIIAAVATRTVIAERRRPRAPLELAALHSEA
ncbi:MAG: DMT family transporter [Dehalococcoidia bacterium]|nr:DMT family transporter [Dehalococcoidia bacterium]